MARVRRTPTWLVRAVQADALLGVVVSAYALYVETQLRESPLYEPACNSFGGSCATVLTSSHAHILSHWGIVPRGHVLDLSLATAGILLYSTYLLAISIPFSFPLREHLFLAAAVSGACFSVYLLYVIKYILHDFCIVCTSFHVCNFFMLVLAILEFRQPSVPWPRKAPVGSVKKQD
ncbi:Vitamin K epoxide reductase complex subunit 1-like protein 1 [Hondaea fermentalgiana]|uniref:vitamin-K-epoxide reductase (warfarin-sensitive) n=1 Tax=Hondaea fermentalgiana TaxID=2315210 RepID=A0A2R5GQV8_9STRA|nr:Vitamin K epoxide reductase complex subunit 1-like protein 1 [Hondaea fermentalgiana]|eukprot:GBG32985.1 Vitamin K epoxide reductase complex subunit 1-like protein 1 [Hondaea fermentalgiana]